MSKTFGTYLRKLRRKSLDCMEDAKQALTQSVFVHELEKVVGLIYTHASISNWERNKYTISHQDRTLLIGIVKVLFKCGGLRSIEEANDLLASGGYSPLTQEEIATIEPEWIGGSTGDEEGISLSEAEQIANLPVLDVTVGIDEVVTHVAQRLADGVHVALFGRRGIGKSTLANASLRRFLKTTTFSELVWLTVTEPVEPTLVAQLVEKLQLSGLHGQPAAMQLHHLRIALQQMTCLIVVDGIENTAQLTAVSAFIAQLPPPTRVLLTTRVAPPVFLAVRPDVIVLEELSHAAALSLLQRLNPNLEDEQLRDIYEQVGGHPEALNLVAHYAKIRPIKQILVALKEMHSPEIEQFFDNIYGEIWAALSAETKQLLRLLCFVSNDGVSEEVLRSAGGFSEKQRWNMIEEANRFGLLRVHGSSDTFWYSLHNLTRYYIHAKEESLHVEALAIVRYWQRRFDVLGSADLHLLAHDRANLFQAVKLSLQVASQQPDLQQALYQLTRTLYQFVRRRGFVPEWIPIHARVVAAEWLTDEQRSLRYNQLGFLYRQQKQLPLALDAHHRSEQLASTLQDAPLLAQAHYNLALDYRDTFDYAKARRFAEKAHEAFVVARPDRTIATHNLLGTIALLTGEFEVAKAHFRGGIALLDADTTTHAHLLINLAKAQREQQKRQDAQATLAQAAALLPSQVTTLHHALWLAQSTLFLALENPDAALQTLSKLEIANLEQAGQFQTAGLMRHNTANAYLLQKLHSKAEFWLREAIKVWELLGNQKNLALSLESLGDALVAQGKDKLAREKYGEALELAEGVGSADYRLQQLRNDLRDKLL